MRILNCIHSVNPAIGGPLELIRRMACLNQSGHVIEVVSLDSPGDAFVSEFPLTVHAVGPGLLSYGFTPKLISFLKSHRQDYDLVIVHGLWQFTSFGTWLALENTNTPLCCLSPRHARSLV